MHSAWSDSIEWLTSRLDDSITEIGAFVGDQEPDKPEVVCRSRTLHNYTPMIDL
jgi:hypothetical protein